MCVCSFTLVHSSRCASLMAMTMMLDASAAVGHRRRRGRTQHSVLTRNWPVALVTGYSLMVPLPMSMDTCGREPVCEAINSDESVHLAA